MTLTSRIVSSPFVRLTIYYVLLGLGAFALASKFALIRAAFSLERLQSLSGGFTPSAPPVADAMHDPVGSAVTALFAIVGGLALLAPVAWVYMVTKQREGYDASVVHTVVILPVAVTGLVIVVQDSLALAFSLAGIVAAVRFRNTLKDTKDAVYIFLSIGTALAAGVQALGIAAVTSVMFNYLVLVMWHLKVGNIYADQRRRTSQMRLGDVLAGAGTSGAGSGTLTIGDPELLAALTPRELGELAERKSRLHDRIKDEKFNGLLIVHADTGDDDVFALIEGVLDEGTKRFELAEVSASPEGHSTLEYLISLSKEVPASTLVNNLRTQASDRIIAAEFRLLKSSKKEKLKHK